MIRGIGLDLVKISRIERLCSRYGQSFTARVFTPAEQGYCQNKGRPAQHFAARFAAKEAVFKLLGAPAGISFHDVEVVSTPSGQPLLKLSGVAAQAAKQLKIKRTLLSLTHEQETAAAVAVGEG